MTIPVKGLRKSKFEIERPNFPMSEFDRFKGSILVELSSRIYEHENKWGVSRLITLVDVGFREKFWMQQERVWVAQNSGDSEKLEKSVKGMMKAYELMEQWAIDNGVEPMPQFKVLEHVKDNGFLMAVCETENAKVDYLRFKGSKPGLSVYTLQEIEAMIEGYLILKEVESYKAEYPDATVKVIERAPSMFDDMEDDLEPLSAAAVVPKFRIPRGK
jgi:hypothetical protein